MKALRNLYAEEEIQIAYQISVPNFYAFQFRWK